MKFRAFLGDFTGVLQWIYRGFQSFFGGSSVVLTMFFGGSSSFLRILPAFYVGNTYEIRMFFVFFGGSSLKVLPQNNSALNRYFFVLFTFQLELLLNDFLIRHNNFLSRLLISSNDHY